LSLKHNTLNQFDTMFIDLQSNNKGENKILDYVDSKNSSIMEKETPKLEVNAFE
jgi:hypothetical protein